MRHKQATHRENRESCDQCEYNAATKGALIEHKKIHHTNNTFHCNQCDHMSETKDGLQKHTEFIPDKKKYVTKRIQCQKCEKKFNKKETFNTHMKKYHNESEN